MGEYIQDKGYVGGNTNILLHLMLYIMIVASAVGCSDKKKNPFYFPPAKVEDEDSAIVLIENKLRDLGYDVDFNINSNFTNFATGQPVMNEFDVYGSMDLDNNGIPEREIYAEFNSPENGLTPEAEQAIEEWTVRGVMPPHIAIQPGTTEYEAKKAIEDADGLYEP